MTIISKKTFELTINECRGIHLLFEKVFERHRTLEVLFAEYTNTVKGYSYHAICEDCGCIVGHVVYVPFKYMNNNKPFFLSLGIDAMVHPGYQGKGLYRKLTEACCSSSIADGCIMRIGFPNENSYPIQVKSFNFNDIGRLNTFCLPIRIGEIYKKLKYFNFLSRLFCKLTILFSTFSKRSNTQYLYKYRKERESFDNIRYRWFEGDYTIIENNAGKFIYKKAAYKKYSATFLVDVYPLSKSLFDTAVRYIYEKEDKESLIIYVGNLPFKPLSMIRIPYCLEPKHFHFVGKVFDENKLQSDILNIKNWELNLSNFDLL